MHGENCIDVLRSAHKVNVSCVELEDGVITGIEASVLKSDGKEILSWLHQTATLYPYTM